MSAAVNLIAQLRTARSWSQVQAAKHSGVTRTTLRRAEAGQIDAMSVRTIMLLACAFELTPGELLDGLLEEHP